MSRVCLRSQRWSVVVGLVLPVTCGHIHVTNHKNVVYSESSWWSWVTWKDRDACHFDKYLQNKCHVNDDTCSLMLWPSLQDGIKQRTKDEYELQNQIEQFKKQRNTLDDKGTIAMGNTLSEILYGKGFSVDDRQVYLEKYGCTKATPQALDIINKVVQQRGDKDRGIVEIGVGYGQWARLLVDTYKIDLVAFDNMNNLPLDPKIHNTKSKGYAQYFYQGKVRYGDEHIFQNEVLKQRYKLDGRVLMMIFPDPGAMAVDCLRSYANSSDKNDTVIYVGEGRGGANANSDFFDELEKVSKNGEAMWVLTHTCKLSPFGEKGFERLFVFSKNPAKPE